MKFNTKNNNSLFLSLLSASLLVCSTTDALEMIPTFREVRGYKNIAFSASIVGGASHYNWVLSIGDELGQRGHNVSFLTTTKDTRFGKPYEHVKTVDLGPAPSYDRVKFMSGLSGSQDTSTQLVKALIEMSQFYERDYLALLSYFDSNKVDLILCDNFSGPCIDAATTSKIPYIVTTTSDFSSESAAPYINHELASMNDPTTEFQSVVKRFKNKFIVPYTFLYKAWPYFKEFNPRRKAVGIDAKMEAPSETWKDSLKLVNNVFGFTAPRPIGPMAEYIGPIIPKTYKPLSDDLEEYLNSHKRIAYIAFGHNAVPSQENVKLILTGLLESIEAGSLDGLLWATVNSAGFFPNTITTSSGTVYNVQEMFDHKNPHARMVKWAPQTAVLLHPSTTLFVSHGGLGSWYESMYSGTPMILFPFFADQPGNAAMIEQGGSGGILKDYFTVEEAVSLFKKVTADEGGKIKANVKRMQALIQIHSDHGVIRGADIVEEVAYTHKDGKLPHRKSADHRMSYIKSHNLDLYTILLSIIALAIFTSFKALGYLFSISKKRQQKLKKL